MISRLLTRQLVWLLLLVLQDGQPGLLGSDEEQAPDLEREGRWPVSGQAAQPQAALGGEAVGNVPQHVEPDPGHCGRDEADPQPGQAHDLSVHRWVCKTVATETKILCIINMSLYFPF